MTCLASFEPYDTGGCFEQDLIQPSAFAYPEMPRGDPGIVHFEASWQSAVTHVSRSFPTGYVIICIISSFRPSRLMLLLKRLKCVIAKLNHKGKRKFD